MPRLPYRIGIGAAALVLLAAIGWAVLAEDPPSSAPPETAAKAPTEAGSPTMTKAVATADQPAIVTLAKPPAAMTRALGAAGETALQLTVRPEAVVQGEPYLVNVYVLPPAGQAGPSGSGETLVGSFSFFPPPRAGEERTFTLPTPEMPAAGGPDVELKVELVPASPDAKLERSTLAVIDAKIAAP